MKKTIFAGLVGILLTSLTLNGQIQNKKYIKNNKDTIVYQESWEGHTQETPYMKYKRELEMKEKTKNNEIIQNEQDTCYYTIKEGDKGYWDIAEKVLYNEKRWKQIQGLNKKFKSEDLKVGQIILIPCK